VAEDLLPPAVRGWRELGTDVSTSAGTVHVHVREGRDDGPTLLLLHGYPSSSFDWRHVIELLPDRRIVAVDFLGFGLSAKPPGHDYSLIEQADLVTEIARAHIDGPITLVAHDMGTSVATELMAREVAGTLDLALRQVVLSNGSVIIERASLRPIQRLMRGRLGPIVSRLANERMFTRQLAAVFSPAHPLTAAEAQAQWALLSYREGHRQIHRLSSYLHERVRYADRWHGAVRDWPGRVDYVWGLLDPVATTNVLDGLRELRPAARVVGLPNLAHYPHLENPPAYAEALQTVLT
jgi:pimeloyl-ACP methyl ester carboxylesterase